MKTLFAIPDMGSGGAERVISILAKEMTQRGFNITILMMFGERIHYELPNDVTIVNLGLMNYPIAKRIKSLRAKLKEISQGKEFAVYAFHDSCLKYILAASVGLKGKVICSERNNPYRKGRSFWKRFLATIPYLLSDYAVFQTPDARAYYGLIKDSKCSVIPNPIMQAQCEWKRNITQNKLISICRLHVQKNISMSLKVIDKLRRDFADIHLDIYGEGNLRPDIERQIAEMELENYVTLKGVTHEVPQKLSEASVFISTSDFEGISNSMLEAMSVGMPIVCTNCPIGGARLMLGDGAGLLSPVNNAEAFAKQVAKILSDRSYAYYLAEGALKKSKEFSPVKIAELWLSAIK